MGEIIRQLQQIDSINKSFDSIIIVSEDFPIEWVSEIYRMHHSYFFSANGELISTGNTCKKEFDFKIPSQYIHERTIENLLDAIETVRELELDMITLTFKQRWSWE